MGSVIGPSVILRGILDFVEIAASALKRNVGWIHPTGAQNTIALLGPCTGLAGLLKMIALKHEHWGEAGLPNTRRQATILSLRMRTSSWKFCYGLVEVVLRPSCDLQQLSFG